MTAATYYFAGHESLSNRGCEALVRGISHVVRAAQPDVRFLLPSFFPERDRQQWPDAEAAGDRLVPAYRLPTHCKLWARIHTRWAGVRSYWWPAPAIPRDVWREVETATVGIMTGGDVLSLDYSMGSLVKYVGQAETLMRAGRPMWLWAASIGPFTGQPDVERWVVRHLDRYEDISVRESSSLEYLRALGLPRARLVADPAFALVPEAFDADALLPPERDGGVLGFNTSPLIHAINERRAAGSGAAAEKAIADFLGDVVRRTRLGVVLVPHVDAVDGGTYNSDFVYLQGLLARMNLPSSRVRLALRTLNAPRIKHLLAQCSYFIGARTHATIGALSQGVPTCSLGYSVKARGLNRDLFGSERYLLDTKSITRDALWQALQRLIDDEGDIRSLLLARMPEWRQRAHSAFVVGPACTGGTA